MWSRTLPIIVLLCFWTNSFSASDEIKITGTRTTITSSIDSKKLHDLLENGSTTEDCLFAGTHRYYKIKEAKNDARRNFHERSYFTYAVGNGFGPQVPASEDIYSLNCNSLDIEERVLWVGGDSLHCKNHSKMNSKAYKYAKKFNLEMVKILKDSELCE